MASFNNIAYRISQGCPRNNKFYHVQDCFLLLFLSLFVFGSFFLFIFLFLFFFLFAIILVIPIYAARFILFNRFFLFFLRNSLFFFHANSKITKVLNLLM